MEALYISVGAFIVTGLIGYLTKNTLTKIKNHSEEHKRLQKADIKNNASMQLIHKAQIMDIYDRGKERGYLGEHDKELANEIFDNYSSRGGNGYVKTVLDKINNMNEKMEA